MDGEARMTRKRDYYAVLGLPRGATEAEIKRAFRDLARKHHPDVNPGDGGEAFREINEAYAVLSDPRARARYDRWGNLDQPSGFGAVVDAAGEVISDILRRRRNKNRGRDLHYTLEITFEEAAFGAQKSLHIPYADGASRDIAFTVAAGTVNGATKQMKGAGEPGLSGGPAGDLQVVIRIAEHAVFRRIGLDVHSDHMIGFGQAALGAILDVPTLDGVVKMRLPHGTQPGRIFRIRGRGIAHGAGKNSSRGDHLVRIQVEVPMELSPRQRQLIEEFSRISGDVAGPAAPRRRLRDRVRSLLTP